MTRYGKLSGLTLAWGAAALVVAPAAAQDLRFVKRVGGYAALGPSASAAGPAV